VAFSGAPIRDRAGALLGFVGISRDMSERNRLVAHLERAKATLERRVEERTRELRRAEAQLFQAEKLSAIGQLAAGIAHEVGTPLNVISGRAEYLLSELAPEDPRAHNLEVILAQIDRITGLVERLLEFARGRGDEMGPTRIARVVDTLLPLLRTRLAQLGIVFDAEVGHLPDVYANPTRLEQVFLNLTLHAMDAIREARPQGPGAIQVRGDVDRDDVVVRFRDDGRGLPPALLSRVFDPFFTPRAPAESPGLGLSVTHGLVQEMGGSIRAESDPQGGTTFTLRLRRTRK
jgi:C4-dicarboxylate-specific signal transduction histidine kinase